MKRIILVLLSVFLFSLNVFAADIIGQWHGVLKEHGVYLKVILNIAKSAGGYEYAATFDSPRQNAKGIPVTSFIFEGNSLKFRIIELGIEYRGSLEEDGIIKGIFEQNGLAFTVNFSREEIKRPQEPSKPYPYIEKEVRFENKAAGITLSGTLTIPRGSKKQSFPAVVLISGSGPNNRDEEVFGHKPFLVIADYLTRNGIAVLRYDKRGTGRSSGTVKGSTTEDFAADAAAAVEYLKTRKEIDANNIGLIGHSEGAAIAAMIAAKQKRIMFIVLLAGQGLPGKEIILKQKKMIGKVSKVKKKELKREIETTKNVINIVGMANTGRQRGELLQYLGKRYDGFTHKEVPKGVGKPDFMRSYISTYMDPWMRYFLSYNPADDLKEVKCPVLALGGSKDLQVSAKDNLQAIKEVLEKSGNPDVTVKMYHGLNHMFQECKTGLPSEYPFIDQTFSPNVLSDILEWIKERIIKKSGE
ncbi:MAG: alpha/beta fold hydrolase [Endomicrobia bacterium]|nr:alpha/beta fold hydrolase [Endomicrobiia bacterium]